MLSIEEQAEFDSLAAVVRAGGFMSLDSKPKRDRYKELKTKIEGQQETITVTKADLERMVNDAVNNYKRAAEDIEPSTPRFGEWKKKQEGKRENPRAKLRVYREDALADPAIVIDLKYKKMIFNEETRKYDVPLYVVTVQYDNGAKKDVEMPLINFIQINEFEEVEIVKQDIEERVMVTGKGERSYSDKGYFYSSPAYFGTKAQANSESFDIEVTKPFVVCTVKRPNGELLVINNERLNA